MNQSFWHEGLRFECARCSACCRYEPGYVFLSADDLRRLHARSGLPFRAFVGAFLRTVDIGTGLAISLKEKPNNDCILWSDGGCAAYESRPIQCATYPFWPGILDSHDDWQDEAGSCPGIGKGPIIGAGEIAERFARKRANRTLVIPYGAALETIDEDSLLGSPRLASDAADPGQAT